MLGWYVLGLPQTFGKVDHDHHLLWCLFVLACSPCGDALAIDARPTDARAEHGATGSRSG